VPYTSDIAIGMTRAHMTDDQRFASSRTDVMVYESDVLPHDVTIVGSFTASLKVSTSGAHGGHSRYHYAMIVFV
jgi:uncharacterized protein